LKRSHFAVIEIQVKAIGRSLGSSAEKPALRTKHAESFGDS